MNLDVLAVGDYCYDIILTGMRGEPVLGREVFAQGLEITLGGATFPTALALRRLGLDVGIQMQLGNDLFSRFALATIENAGLDTSLLEHHPQALRRVTVALSYPQDRAFLSFADDPPAASPGGRFGSGPLKQHQVRHVHFAHLSAALAASDLIAEAKCQGLTISSDCGWNPSAMDDPKTWDVLGKLDIFMPNEAELRRVTGAEGLRQAMARIREHVGLTVLKQGAQGAMALTRAKELRVAAIPVEPLETTGAGDCFDAGFLFGYLQGWPLEKALLSGNICGGLSTTASGWDAAPGVDVLIEWLARCRDG